MIHLTLSHNKVQLTESQLYSQKNDDSILHFHGHFTLVYLATRARARARVILCVPSTLAFCYTPFLCRRVEVGE